MVERFFVLFPSMSPLTQSRLFGMEMFQSKLEAGKTERQDFELFETLSSAFLSWFLLYFVIVLLILLIWFLGYFTFLFSSDTLKHFQKSNEIAARLRFHCTLRSMCDSSTRRCLCSVCLRASSSPACEIRCIQCDRCWVLVVSVWCMLWSWWMLVSAMF